MDLYPKMGSDIRSGIYQTRRVYLSKNRSKCQKLVWRFQQAV